MNVPLLHARTRGAIEISEVVKTYEAHALLETYDRTGVTIFFITHDLEEAIFLGHRVVAMTSRPCRPKRIFTVDVPHPRHYDVLTSPRFRELAAEVSAVVDEEAVKSFVLGEKEG
jgi:NitT/TauT family transport system ATP-binding protein